MLKTVPIKKNSEFLRAYKKGRFYAGRLMVLYVLSNSLNINRLGITAGKKVGKSVKRNRLRRLVRENYRLYESCVKEGYDLVFVIREAAVAVGFAEIKAEMKFLFKRLNVFDQEKWDCLRNF